MVKNSKRNQKMVALYRSGKSIKEISEKYFMTESAIRAILRVELGNEYFSIKEERKSMRNKELSGLEPRRATKFSAGYDFVAPSDIHVKAHDKAYFDTEVEISISQDKVMLLFIRSSLGIKHGITLANGTGVIDSDYHETIKCLLVNNSDEDYLIKKGDRFMQGVIVKYYLLENDKVVDQERTSGIGSTGK